MHWLWHRFASNNHTMWLYIVATSSGYNNGRDFLWLGEVSRSMLDHGGVHPGNVTPVEVQGSILMNATGYPPLLTHTVDAFLTAIVAL